jgi:cytochrome c553
MFIRPKSEIFKMDWPPSGYNQAEEGKRLASEYKLQSTGVLTSCSTCHR